MDHVTQIIVIPNVRNVLNIRGKSVLTFLRPLRLSHVALYTQRKLTCQMFTSYQQLIGSRDVAGVSRLRDRLSVTSWQTLIDRR